MTYVTKKLHQGDILTDQSIPMLVIYHPKTDSYFLYQRGRLVVENVISTYSLDPENKTMLFGVKISVAGIQMGGGFLNVDSE